MKMTTYYYVKEARCKRPPETRAFSPWSRVRHGGRAQPELLAAGPRPGGHSDGGERTNWGRRKARASGATAGAPRKRRTPAPGAQKEGREGREAELRRTAPRGLPRPCLGSGAVGVHSGSPPLPAPQPRPGPATKPSLPKTRRAGWCAAAGPVCGGRRRPRLCLLRTHPLPSCLHPRGAPRSARAAGPCACAAPPPPPRLARLARLGLPRGGVVRGERGRAWAARVHARAQGRVCCRPGAG